MWVEHINSFLLAVIVCLLGFVARQMDVLTKRLEVKVDEKDCIEHRGRLAEENKGVWGAINNHSHTGLNSDSRVIR